jgi:hypothetical protein
LVHILPGVLEDRVECKLVHTFLGDDQEPYSALSYVWGELSHPLQINLEGRDFNVTANLGAALKQLRDTSATNVMWIDAISINQTDLNERSEQVSKMRTIYQRARSLYIWLGPSTNNSKLAFILLNDLRTHFNHEDRFNSIIQDPNRLKQFEALLGLWERDYWWRAWVVQEVISGRNITIHCGCDSMAWLDMIAVQEKLVKQVRGYYQVIFTSHPTLKHFPTYLPLRGAKALGLPYRRLPTDTPDFFEILLWHCSKQSSDPRDKIYSVVGLSSAREDPLLVIDYSRSVRQIYTDVVRYVVRTYRKLDILCAMPRSTNTFDLPSWVPNWAEWPKAYMKSLLATKDEEGSRPVAPFVVYSASGSQDAVVQPLSDDGVLIARGVCIGIVDAVGAPSILKEWTDVHSMTLSFYDWYQLLVSKRGDNASQRQAFCRTLIGGMGRKKTPDGSSRDDPNLLRELFGAYVRMTRNFHPTLHFDAQLTALADACEAPEAWAIDWARDATGVVSNRRFVLTLSGIIGLGPKTTEPGDKICILLGCCIPVILRQEVNHHIFVDQAYIDEYMFGKALEEVDAGIYKLEDFELR